MIYYVTVYFPVARWMTELIKNFEKKFENRLEKLLKRVYIMQPTVRGDLRSGWC